MREDLWPASHEDHAREIDAYLDGTSNIIDQAFVCDQDGRAIAFVELRLRDYAEGSDALVVPYVEGWYVAPQCRGLGIGRALIERAEKWAREGGFRELASDAELDNTHSIRAHRALGFDEVERVVCFIKRLEE